MPAGPTATTLLVCCCWPSRNRSSQFSRSITYDTLVYIVVHLLYRSEVDHGKPKRRKWSSYCCGVSKLTSGSSEQHLMLPERTDTPKAYLCNRQRCACRCAPSTHLALLYIRSCCLLEACSARAFLGRKVFQWFSRRSISTVRNGCSQSGRFQI